MIDSRDLPSQLPSKQTIGGPSFVDRSDGTAEYVDIQACGPIALAYCLFLTGRIREVDITSVAENITTKTLQLTTPGSLTQYEMLVVPDFLATFNSEHQVPICPIIVGDENNMPVTQVISWLKNGGVAVSIGASHAVTWFWDEAVDQTAEIETSSGIIKHHSDSAGLPADYYVNTALIPPQVGALNETLLSFVRSNLSIAKKAIEHAEVAAKEPIDLSQPSSPIHQPKVDINWHTSGDIRFNIKLFEDEYLTKPPLLEIKATEIRPQSSITINEADLIGQ